MSAWEWGCEAIEAYFAYGPQRCGRMPTTNVACRDCIDREAVHMHAVCDEHAREHQDAS